MGGQLSQEDFDQVFEGWSSEVLASEMKVCGCDGHLRAWRPSFHVHLAFPSSVATLSALPGEHGLQHSPCFHHGLASILPPCLLWPLLCPIVVLATTRLAYIRARAQLLAVKTSTRRVHLSLLNTLQGCTAARFEAVSFKRGSVKTMLLLHIVETRRLACGSFKRDSGAQPRIQRAR